MMPLASCACLGALPSELICEILARIDSVASLYSVLTAWPRANLVFSSSIGPVLLARTLEESLPGQLVSLVSATARVMLQTEPVLSPEAVRDGYFRPPKGRHVGRAQPIPQPSPPAADTPAADAGLPFILGNNGQAARRLLGQVVRIARAATACLEHYSTQCRLITPQHLVRPRRNLYRHGDSRRPPWRETAAGRPYVPPEFHCCSWQEGQRAMRGLWRLRLAEALAQSAAERNVSLDLFFFADSEPWGEQDELLTAAEYLGYSQNAPLNPIRPKDDIWCWPVAVVKASTATASLPWETLLSPLHEVDTRSRGTLRLATAGWQHWVRLASHPASPVRGVPFWPFRHLGFALWDREKLETMQLVPLEVKATQGGDRGVASQAEWFFTWRSLVPAGLRTEIEERLDRDLEGCGQDVRD
ncbi:uncharacterized protein N0V89_008070 [Didymosphaeria variabile]|uniref:F-box domain-containing protein n=1 Tax=Didymosphaeria variabile TaxID=1932322 RepID=A0A9W8XF96_9PLEO|nr:uncharacterized protein N0V89_008070 [Didymosphaeria variabile]KAJ4349455.1 hypothetical protein N0V89_008070 [Didymosphaeria variabile]